MSHSTKFSNKLTTVLVTAGCSVGLGNIWRFPYVAGESGGGAFVLIYLLAAILIGIPILLAEYSMGRETQRSAVDCYRKLDKRWILLGVNGVLSSFFILSFYYVVAGWTAEYFTISLTGELAQHTSPESLKSLFSSFVADPVRPIIFTWLFILANHLIISLGVEKGIERMSVILMPLLFVMLIVLAINSLMLPNAGEGALFFLKPDFSKITPGVVLMAVGQAFFSLSVGLGAMIAYGSYVKNSTNLVSSALQISMLDIFVSVMAGLIIFPATSSLGIDPSSGPALVFETLPAIFQQLPLSMLWSTIFFALLIIAALTSTMSLHEVLTVFQMEEWGFSRKKGAAMTTFVMLGLSAICSLSLGIWGGFKIGGLNIFDAMDWITSNVMLPLGGMLTAIFVSWFYDKKMLRQQITNHSKVNINSYPIFAFLLKYICPIVIFLVFLDSVNII